MDELRASARRIHPFFRISSFAVYKPETQETPKSLQSYLMLYFTSFRVSWLPRMAQASVGR